MLGSRTRIVLLTSFFTFAFAISFLALAQNYVHASSPSLPPVRIVAVTSDTSSAIERTVVGDFALPHMVASFDFDNDDSLQKFLSTYHPFLDTSYVPADLLPITSSFTANDVRKFKLREEAGIAFADMAWHFRDAFDGDKLAVTSAYRSKWYQDYLVKQWCSANACAQAGTSEHQAWLAVDLKVVGKWGRWCSLDVTEKTNKYYDWLKDNAAKFGFHNTYQKWVAVDGKIVEWRHRRYLWVELATLLAEKNQTLAEYYKSTKN